MTSFQITTSPSRRAAARFVTRVRRELLKALAEENARSGLTQSDLARAIGVHRSVINRELRGFKDITLGRVAELSWALGRRASIALPQAVAPAGANVPPRPAISIIQSGTGAAVHRNHKTIMAETKAA
jgi:hypothetical protein